MIDPIEEMKRIRVTSEDADTLRKVVQEVTRLRAELAAAKKWGTDLSNELGQRIAELVEARRLLDEAAKQEPIYQWQFHGDEDSWRDTDKSDYDYQIRERICRQRIVYARPVPPHPSVSVADICNAYESGVGHVGRPTAKVNPYREGTHEHESYAIGASGSKHNGQPSAAPEAVAKDVSDAVLLKAYTTETGKVLGNSWRPIFLDYARIGIRAASKGD